MAERQDGRFSPLKHRISWDEKQSLFKWKGSLEGLRDFSTNVLDLHLSPTAGVSDKLFKVKASLSQRWDPANPRSIHHCLSRPRCENYLNYQTMRNQLSLVSRKEMAMLKTLMVVRNCRMEIKLWLNSG